MSTVLRDGFLRLSPPSGAVTGVTPGKCAKTLCDRAPYLEFSIADYVRAVHLPPCTARLSRKAMEREMNRGFAFLMCLVFAFQGGAILAGAPVL
jgi:hypothetical protein